MPFLSKGIDVFWSYRTRLDPKASPTAQASSTTAATLPAPEVPANGQPLSTGQARSIEEGSGLRSQGEDLTSCGQSPPPRYPDTEASSSRPPPFSTLYDSFHNHAASAANQPPSSCAPLSLTAPAYSAALPGPSDTQSVSSSFSDTVAETKRALPRDTKTDTTGKEDEAEPPPAYSEGPSPLPSFGFLMATAGGASSIITQVQQGGPPINAIGGKCRRNVRVFLIRGG